MSTHSHKSSAKKIRAVHLPQRANGRARVAAILQAAETVIEEKGYESTTMAEIAERSGTKIGSLYRFFPNKQSLADTIVVSAREKLDAEFDRFDAEAASLSIRALADGLIALILDRLSRSAAKKLLEVDQDWSVKREEFRLALLRRIANTLLIHTPSLSKQLVEDIAQVLVLNMKTMAMHKAFFNTGSSTEDEFRDMVRLYLQSRLRSSQSKTKGEPS